MKITVAVIAVIFPVTVCACGLVKPEQAEKPKQSEAPSQTNDLVKSCIVENSNKSLKIEFGDVYLIRREELSPADVKNGVSEEELIEVRYISSSDGKKWENNSVKVRYRIVQEKVEFWVEKGSGLVVASGYKKSGHWSPVCDKSTLRGFL